MKYHLLTIPLLALFFFVQVQSDEEIECYECEQTENDGSDCKDGKVTRTCKGRMCYQYRYKEDTYKIKGGRTDKIWYYRGCTKDYYTCKPRDVSLCKLCTEPKCNKEGIHIPDYQLGGFGK